MEKNSQKDWSVVRDAHEAPMAHDLFERAQARCSEDRKENLRHGRGKNSPFLRTSLLICSLERVRRRLRKYLALRGEPTLRRFISEEILVKVKDPREKIATVKGERAGLQAGADRLPDIATPASRDFSGERLGKVRPEAVAGRIEGPPPPRGTGWRRSLAGAYCADTSS